MSYLSLSAYLSKFEGLVSTAREAIMSLTEVLLLAVRHIIQELV
jgi:hypothetical protein